MKTNVLATSALLAGLIAVGSSAAMASDQLAGALIGAGAGAVVGNAVGGRDAAVAGGFIGAILGAAVADHDHHRTIVSQPHRHRAYVPPPAHRHYAPRPHWNGPHQASHWRHDRDFRYERSRDRERIGWRDDRRGGNGHGPRPSGQRDHRHR